MVELITKNKQRGKITLGKEVLQSMAKTAALEVEGVLQPTDTGYSDFNPKKYGKGLHHRWVRIETEPNLEITLNIHIMHGYKIPDVSAAVQQKVQSEIETMTGIENLTVNIIATGIAA